MPLITYRAFQEPDAEAVHACALAAWQHTYQGIFSASFILEFVQSAYHPDQLRGLAGLVADDALFFDLALDDQIIIGFCNIGLTPTPTLYRIYLQPAYIGTGIGTALLGRGERFLARHGVGVYQCFVHKDNQPAQKFYHLHGFLRCPERDRDDEYALEKQLDVPGASTWAKSKR